MKMCLNLGCGTDYKESTDTETWVNVDIDRNVKTDLCGDACQMPGVRKHSNPNWTNKFDHIYSNHVLEHFRDLFEIVDEMARVSRDKATWEHTTPYCTWQQNIGNPHHHIQFHESTFKFFGEIYKRGHDKDYWIETVKVEYEWNEAVVSDIENINKHTGAYHSMSRIHMKNVYLNVVKSITFYLKVHKK